MPNLIVADRDPAQTLLEPEDPAGVTMFGPPMGGPASPRTSGMRYFQTLRRKKLWLLGAAILGGMLGFAIVLPQIPIYQARTTIEVAAINESFLNVKQADPIAYPAPGGEAANILTQITILKSNSLRARVLAMLGAPLAFRESDELLVRWGFIHQSAMGASAQAISMAAQSADIRTIPGTRVVEITIDSTQPAIAATFANTMVNEFIDQNIDARWQASLRTEAWLSKQLEDMRRKIEVSEARLQQYARSTGLLFTSDKTTVSEQRLRELQGARSSAETERIGKQSRFEMLQQGTVGSAVESLTDDSLRGYEDKIAELRRMIAEQSVIYTPEHDKSKGLLAQLAAVENSYRLARKALEGKIGEQYQEAMRKERLLEAGFLAQTNRVVSEQEKATQYNLLKAEVESNRQLYDSMQLQLKQSSVASAMKASNIRIVDAAAIPTRPYKPNLSRSMILGSVLGLFAAVGVTLLRERSDHTIRDVGEVTDILGIPVPAPKRLSPGRRKKNGSIRPGCLLSNRP
jgi:succinoglycan biosynthesis transport protein ExoP